MAEIPIQEKRGGSTSWLWIVALIAVALLAWMFLANDDADDVDGRVPAAETGVLAPVPTTTVPPLYLAA